MLHYHLGEVKLYHTDHANHANHANLEPKPEHPVSISLGTYGNRALA